MTAGCHDFFASMGGYDGSTTVEDNLATMRAEDAARARIARSDLRACLHDAKNQEERRDCDQQYGSGGYHEDLPSTNTTQDSGGGCVRSHGGCKAE